MKDYREYNCTTKKDVKQAFKDLKETARQIIYELEEELKVYLRC